MTDESQWITEWVAYSDIAKPLLESDHGCRIETIVFRDAVAFVLGLGRSEIMVGRELPEVESLVKSLRGYDFASFDFVVLQEIRVDESLIPETDETPRMLTEQTLKTGNEIWRIHQNDADPFPSSPHAHNLETGLKLHLGNGKLYKKTKLSSAAQNFFCKSG